MLLIRTIFLWKIPAKKRDGKFLAISFSTKCFVHASKKVCRNDTQYFWIKNSKNPTKRWCNLFSL